MTSPSVEFRQTREFASEVKFLLSPDRACAIQAWAERRLEPDPYAAAQGGYRVTSLYLDTDKLDVYFQQGSFGRTKYRVRRYGDAEQAFLERKLKHEGRVGKIRSQVLLDDLIRLEGRAPERDWAGYWFHRRMLARRLRTACQISYFRRAFGAPGIRLTLDDDLRMRPASRMHFGGEGVEFCEGKVILELKYRQEFPAAFKQLIGEFALNPFAVSKYRMAAAKCLNS